MQDNEKINYTNYPLLFDGCLAGYDTQTKGFDYLYEMLPYFVTTEITSKRRNWEELGFLLDNAYLTYKKPNEFLKFFYDGFYPLYLQRVNYEPIHDGVNVVTLSLVTDYVINWLGKKMESRAVNNDTKDGLIIREMYEIIRQRVTSPQLKLDEKKSRIKPCSAKVVLEVIAKIDENEHILPINLKGRAMFQEYANVIRTKLGDRFDYKAGTLQNNYRTPLNSSEQEQVFEILKQFGYDDLASQYRLKDRVRN